MPELKIDFIDGSTMEWACKRWHYAGGSQSGAAVCFGVWEDGRFIGGLQFTRGSGGVFLTGRRFGVDKMQVSELARIALGKHETAVSRIGAIAFRLLRRGWPSLRLLVSYADPGHEHHGGIYQAMNWAFAGKTADDFVWVDSAGRRYHSRALSSTRKPAGLAMRKEAIGGKYRYLYALDPSIWPQLRAAALPYPKRVRSETIDTAGVQSAERGETPTRTLQV